MGTLDWNDMQRLAAGVLRAMGYKTRGSFPRLAAGAQRREIGRVARPTGPIR